MGRRRIEVSNAQQGAEVALAALVAKGAIAGEPVKYLPNMGIGRFMVMLPSGRKLWVRVEEED